MIGKPRGPGFYNLAREVGFLARRTARILLLGLLPREESPSARLRLEMAQVNRLIRDCADGEHIFYAEIGQVLLDRDGLLPAAISPDQLHFTALGYALLAARLEPELDRLPGPSR